MELKTIGQNIRKRRIEKGLKQEELAELTGFSSNYIGMIERGEKIPSLDTFIQIINTLDISADVVLADVTVQGYAVKKSLLDEKISKLTKEDQERIFDVVNTLIQHSKQK